MRKTLNIWIVAAVSWVAVPAGFAADESDKMMSEYQAWLEAIKSPGPEHKRLDLIVGDWNKTVRLWPEGPDKDPVEYTGTAKRRWVLGDRFVEEVSENPQEEGQAYKSVGYYAYDRVSGLYEHLWMSTESTRVFREAGRFDSALNSIRTAGVQSDPSTGRLFSTQTDLKIVSPDEHILTGYVTGVDGQEFREIEIVFTRK